MSFGRSSIDLNKGSLLQTVTATASDTSPNGDPSGVASIWLDIRGKRFGTQVKLQRSSGTPAAGDWTGQFAVSKYARPGTYSIAFIDVADAAGNDQVYYGNGSVPSGPNALSLHPADDPTFTVTGTPATPPPPTAAGTLRSFTFRPTSVDTTSSPRPVHVIARFTGSEPRHVFVEFISLERTGTRKPVFLRGVLRRHAGTWSGTVRIPQWLGKQVVQPYLSADFGRGYRPSERSYSPDDLASRHFPSKLTIVSGVDKTKPTLTSLTFSPSSVDSTAHAERVTVTAAATDVGSGVRYVYVNGGIRHGINGVDTGSYPMAAAGIGYLSSDDFHVRLRKTSSGDWVGTTTVRQCVPSGTYKLEASLRDAAGNYRDYSTKQLAAAQITSTLDVTSKHGDVAPPYVYSAATYGAASELFLNFSEGVANVNTATLAVYPLSPKRTRFQTPATITTMTCANGKATVDCSGSAGLVTSAALTIPSMNPGLKYVVYANLDQVTPQLTDGNGNPMNWNDAAYEVQDS